MRLIKALATSSLLALAAPAFAGVLLDFEPIANPNTALTDLQAVGDYYKSSYGISFTGDAYALIDSNVGGSGNFGNAPSRWTGVWLSQPTDTPTSLTTFTINVNGGFDSLFSLYYTTTAGAFSGNVSLRDASGVAFANFALPAITRSCALPPDSSGDTADNFYCWDNAVFDFSSFGKSAYSVQITGSDSDFLFDNMAFGDATNPPTDLPEPAGMALSLAALGALAWTRRRQRTAR